MTDDAVELLTVTVRDDAQGAYELRLVGEIDVSSLPLLTDHVHRVLDAAPSRVSFDMHGVSFMDSSGIGALIEVAAAVPAVALVNPSPAVQRLVELSGLTSVLPVTGLSTMP